MQIIINLIKNLKGKKNCKKVRKKLKITFTLGVGWLNIGGVAPGLAGTRWGVVGEGAEGPAGIDLTERGAGQRTS
jgi:hypothetical protein